MRLGAGEVGGGGILVHISWWWWVWGRWQWVRRPVLGELRGERGDNGLLECGACGWWVQDFSGRQV